MTFFPEPFIADLRVEKNISKHLVRTSHPQQPTDNAPGTFPCGRSMCITCPVVGKNTLINILGPNGNRFSVNQHFTCTSTNLVYILVCGRCNCLYVGETKRRLADRVTEHLRSIKQNLQGYPVATHFNPPSPCSIKDLAVTVALMCRGSDRDRLTAENRLIMKLGTLPHTVLTLGWTFFNSPPFEIILYQFYTASIFLNFSTVFYFTNGSYVPSFTVFVSTFVQLHFCHLMKGLYPKRRGILRKLLALFTTFIDLHTTIVLRSISTLYYT